MSSDTVCACVCVHVCFPSKRRIRANGEPGPAGRF